MLMTTRPKNLDLNQLAKRILDEATGEEEKASEPKIKDSSAVKRGKARAEKLTPEQRSKIAKLAAQQRWSKQSAIKPEETPTQKKYHIKTSDQHD